MGIVVGAIAVGATIVVGLVVACAVIFKMTVDKITETEQRKHLG